MDDEDSKVRRNLVAASTLVLVTAWLDVPLPALGEKLIGLRADSACAVLEPWRVWSAVLAVLMYLGLRYRFAEGSTRVLSDIRQEWRANVEEKTKAVLNRHLVRYSRTGRDSPLFPNSLEAVAKVLIDRGRSQHADRVPVQPSLKVDSFTLINVWSGSLRLAYEWHPDSTSLLIGNTDSDYVVKGWRKLWFGLTALVNAGTYSRASIQSLVPVVLWFCAVATVIWKMTV